MYILWFSSTFFADSIQTPCSYAKQSMKHFKVSLKTQHIVAHLS